MPKQIHSLDQVLELINSDEPTEFYVAVNGWKADKDIAFSKSDLTQLSMVHKIEGIEELINIAEYEKSTLYRYIEDGILYTY